MNMLKPDYGNCCYILRALQVQFSCALLSIVNGGYLLLYSLPYFYAFLCSLPAI